MIVYSLLIYLLQGISTGPKNISFHLNRLYAVLSQVNQTIVHVKSQQELLESICDMAMQFGDFSLAWVSFWRNIRATQTGSRSWIGCIGTNPSHRMG